MLTSINICALSFPVCSIISSAKFVVVVKQTIDAKHLTLAATPEN